MVRLTAELAQCPVAADKVIDGKVPDPTSGQRTMRRPRLPVAPKWTNRAKMMLTRGHHAFFKSVS